MAPVGGPSVPGAHRSAPDPSPPPSRDRRLHARAVTASIRTHRGHLQCPHGPSRGVGAAHDGRPWPPPRPTRRPRSCGAPWPPRGGPRHVRHRQLPTGVHRRPPGRATAPVPWSDDRGLPHGRVRGCRARPSRPDSGTGSTTASRRRAHPRAVHYLDGLAPPGDECARYAALLEDHPLDLCCLGIGENGHLAFNDPPVADFDDPLDVKVVTLDEGCRRQQVNEGHFPTDADVPARP